MIGENRKFHSAQCIKFDLDATLIDTHLRPPNSITLILVTFETRIIMHTARLDAQSKPVVHISGKHSKSAPKASACAHRSEILTKLTVASPRVTANCAIAIFIYWRE